MSATPIPRTLYMSLSGIKDMSVINTPPKNRLPIKTYVGNWNENIVKNAIIHELDREGQVFYLYNRVETIEEMKMQLQMLVPNARIAVGHGQMNEGVLEQVIVGAAVSATRTRGTFAKAGILLLSIQAHKRDYQRGNRAA